MRKVTAPILALCDAAHVREGLLGVLGAGITEIRRDGAYPAPLSAQVALQVHVVDVAENTDFKFALKFEHEDGQPTGIDDLIIETTVHEPTGLLSMPLVVDARDMPVPRAGQYRVALVYEGRELSSIAFMAS